MSIKLARYRIRIKSCSLPRIIDLKESEVSQAILNDAKQMVMQYSSAVSIVKDQSDVLTNGVWEFEFKLPIYRVERYWVDNWGVVLSEEEAELATEKKD